MQDYVVSEAVICHCFFMFREDISDKVVDNIFLSSGCNCLSDLTSGKNPGWGAVAGGWERAMPSSQLLTVLTTGGRGASEDPLGDLIASKKSGPS